MSGTLIFLLLKTLTLPWLAEKTWFNEIFVAFPTG